MARRMFLGNVGQSHIDLRISRPSFDAYYDDVNNRLKISFAMSRDVFGRVASAGFIGAVNAAAPFSESFPAPPPVVFGVFRDGQMLIDDYRRVSSGIRYQDGNPFVAVVTASSILITTPLDFGYALPSPSDGFAYMAVA